MQSECVLDKRKIMLSLSKDPVYNADDSAFQDRLSVKDPTRDSEHRCCLIGQNLGKLGKLKKRKEKV